MNMLEKIEQQITSLTPADLHKLADWLAEYRADLWKKQIEEDAKAGKLDKLAEQALAEHYTGLTKPL